MIINSCRDVNAEGNARFEGYAVDLIEEIAESVGFAYEFVLVEKYGKYDTVTKEWSGLIRELMDRVSFDVSIEPALEFLI